MVHWRSMLDMRGLEQTRRRWQHKMTQSTVACRKVSSMRVRIEATQQTAPLMAHIADYAMLVHIVAGPRASWPMPVATRRTKTAAGGRTRWKHEEPKACCTRCSRHSCCILQWWNVSGAPQHWCSHMRPDCRPAGCSLLEP